MKFAIGDHVRVIRRVDACFDEVGVVDSIIRVEKYPFRVAGMRDWPMYYAADELILAEPEPQQDGTSELGAAEGVPVAPEVNEGRKTASSDPVNHLSLTDADKLRMIADTVDGQAPFGTELANFRRRLLAILNIGERR